MFVHSLSSLFSFQSLKGLLQPKRQPIGIIMLQQRMRFGPNKEFFQIY
jgi:hypothetical protein